MKDTITTVVDTARRVCDERMLLHNVVDGSLSHGDCPACTLREALAVLDSTMETAS